MKVNETGEFRLIERIARETPFPLSPEFTGIGDDCAVLPLSGDSRQLVTTDLLVEDIHFKRAWISARELGRKSLAVNLSDIAAMGGKPDGAFVSLGLPSQTDVEWVLDFYRGFLDLAEKTFVTLLGGDTTGSAISIIINITVIGQARADRIRYRHGALPDDVLFVTGCLGDSAAGLKLLRDGIPLQTDCERRLAQRHIEPRPHLEEGAWLASRPEVHAMMDVSDGLDSDTRRIMERSNRGARIDLDLLPLSPEFKLVASRHGWDGKELAATGGEDYCLLLSAAPGQSDNLAEDFLKRFRRELFRVGEILGVENRFVYLRNGREYHLRMSGFEHFNK